MIPTKPLNLSIYAACGVDTLGSSDHVSDGGPDLLREGARLRGTYPAVDILKVIRKVAAHAAMRLLATATAATC